MKKILLFIFALFASLVIHSQTIHVIAVASTNDPSLGKGCISNLERLDKQLNQIEDLTKLPINKIYLRDDNVSSRKIQEYIQQLQCKDEDVILFHYSGHGMNSGRSKWPMLLVSGRTRLSLWTVYEMLKNKNARLLLVLGDACNGNSRISNALMNHQQISSRQTGSETLKYIYDRLFKYERGHIIASSSQPGFSSYYSPYMGGYFTLSFFESIIHLTKQTIKFNWEDVFQLTARMTEKTAKEYGKIQRPQYVIYKLPAKTAHYITYKVKRQDSLYEIAKNFEVKVHEIKQWNQLSSDLIKIGDKLKIYRQ